MTLSMIRKERVARTVPTIIFRTHALQKRRGRVDATPFFDRQSMRNSGHESE